SSVADSCIATIIFFLSLRSKPLESLASGMFLLLLLHAARRPSGLAAKLLRLRGFSDHPVTRSPDLPTPLSRSLPAQTRSALRSYSPARSLSSGCCASRR